MSIQKIKHAIYIIASILLWLLFSIIIHAWIEIWMIGKIMDSNLAPQPVASTKCYLPVYLQTTIAVVGIVFGYIVGERWWRIVYVKKQHWRFRKK